VAKTRLSRFDGWVPEAAAFVVAVVVALFANHRIEALVHGWLASDGSGIYSALVGLHGSLLGFELAALTIVMGYIQTPRFEVIEESGQLGNLLRTYLASIRASSIAVGSALVGLVVIWPSWIYSLSGWLVTLTSTVAFMRLVRTLWVTGNVVHLIALPANRKAGQA
jgi:hypothetical protein